MTIHGMTMMVVGRMLMKPTLLGAKGIATRSKGLTTRNKKLVETI